MGKNRTVWLVEKMGQYLNFLIDSCKSLDKKRLWILICIFGRFFVSPIFREQLPPLYIPSR